MAQVVRPGGQILDQLKRSRVQPLQIVQKQGERMLLARKHPEEAPENHLEPVVRVLRRQVRDRRLFPDHELQLGNEIDHELAVRAQRLAEGYSPAAKLRFALAQQRADKALEGLAHRRIW